MGRKIGVYLDNCVYNRPFDDLTKIKIALKADVKWYSSDLLSREKRRLNRYLARGQLPGGYSANGIDFTL